MTLASEQGASALRENVAIQHAGGAHWIDLLDPTQLSREFPWLSVDGVGLGAFGRKNEGYFDPWGLLDAARRGAKALGVQYMSGEARPSKSTRGRVASVALKRVFPELRPCCECVRRPRFRADAVVTHST